MSLPASLVASISPMNDLGTRLVLLLAGHSTSRVSLALVEGGKEAINCPGTFLPECSSKTVFCFEHHG